MAKNNQKTALLTILLLLFLALAIVMCIKGFYFTAGLLFIVAGYFFYEIVSSINRVLRTVEQTITALHREDYSVKIPQQKLPEGLYLSLQKLLKTQQKRNEDSTSVQLLYETIIESIDTGILILKEEKEGVNIFFSNGAFGNLLEIPKYNHWHLLQPHLQAFEAFLLPEHWREAKEIVTLAINEKEQIFSFRTYLTRVYGARYLIVHLDTLQSIIDKKEKEAWYNLMKVMSHEILNTITPINSLSHNLEYLIEERKADLQDDFADIHQSVVTIKKRTQHLSDFVNTYRALTELPSPKKERIRIQEVIQNALSPLKTLIETRNIKVTVTVSPDNLYFHIDPKQIEQVLVNLITNAVYALSESEEPNLIINAYSDGKDSIEIIDNGVGIPPEHKRDIFVPFFTTRENGSGIGLSLSKNIVQAHDGFLTFNSELGKTVFTIRF